MKEEIVFGNYNGEPLVWLPVHKRNENTPYILKHSICKMKFDDHHNGYRDSLIRKFLVEDFTKNAFSDKELQLLERKENAYGDFVWLIEFGELFTSSFSYPNRKILKETSWWLGSKATANSFTPVEWGAIGLFGFGGDAPKTMKYGVRPCIQFKEPPQF